MSKIVWKPGTMVYPLPAVLVSCGNKNEGYNLLTVAWTGTICTNPPMCYVSIRPERFSHDIIKKNGDFVINLTNKNLVFATDWCGVKSGRDFDKFKEMNLTPVEGSNVKAPLVKESPINIECQVKEIKSLGSHDMFISEVVAINASNEYFDKSDESFKLSEAEMICYSHGKYYSLNDEPLGKFGYSVSKKKYT